MGNVIRPVRVLLDSRDWVYISRLRKGGSISGKAGEEKAAAYRRIDSCIETGLCVPVFYETLAYEWVNNGSLEAAREIAAILDSGIAYKRILPDDLICLVEVLAECKRVEPAIPFPGFVPICEFERELEFHAWFSTVWPEPEEQPSLYGQGGPGAVAPTVRYIVDAIAEEIQRSTNTFKTAIDGHRHSLETTRATQSQPKVHHLTDVLKREWLCRALLLNKVLVRLLPGIDAKQIIETLSLENCPAVELRLAVFWHYAKACAMPHDHDWIDISMVPAIPYVDACLMEGRMYDYVKRAKKDDLTSRTFRDPRDLVDFLDGQGG